MSVCACTCKRCCRHWMMSVFFGLKEIKYLCFCDQNPSSSGYLALPLWCVCVCVFDGSGWQLDLCLHSGCGDDCFIIGPCVNQGIFNGCRTSPSIRVLWALRKPLNLFIQQSVVLFLLLFFIFFVNQVACIRRTANPFWINS